MNHNLTIVTGLWDLGRDQLQESFKRTYSHYLEKFKELLLSTKEYNLIIYIDRKDEEFVWTHRDRCNTQIIYRSKQDFRDWFEFSNQVDHIRNRPEWQAQAGWLSESPQCALDGYATIVMSKMFLLNDVALMNPFNTQFFLWVDGALPNTVHSGYFSHDKVLDQVTDYMDPFLFLSFPYIGSEEIHGFERTALARHANTDYVKYVCRGGLFGGTKESIHFFNTVYYNTLKQTLIEGLMGTEESIFTIMAHKFPERINRYMLQEHGMIANFCEAVKTKKVEFEKIEKSEKTPLINQSVTREKIVFSPNKQKDISIYVLTFNFPQQFKMVLESMRYQKEFLTETNKFLIDNSTDWSTEAEYRALCQEYGFDYLKMNENLGICRGRQYVADHFNGSGARYYVFFEDDMLFTSPGAPPCKCGMNSFVPALLSKSINILEKETLDYLKLSFSEFFGDNGRQWAWYNVPGDVRQTQFPDQPNKRDDVEPPRTKIERIDTVGGVSYAVGEFHYDNWPLLFSRRGNQKVFIDTKWAHPHEQTWMSLVFQEMRKGNIRAGCLLASPINHNRSHHYGAEERKEC